MTTCSTAPVEPESEEVRTDPGEHSSSGVTPRRPRPRWRAARWGLATLVVAALVVELVAGHRELLRAVRAVSDPDWRWLTAALAVDVASMVAFGGMQLRLLRGAGVAVRRRTATSLAFAAHSLSITLPGGPVFSTAYNFRRMAALGATRAVASWVIAVSATLSSLALALIGAGAGLATGVEGDVGHLLAAAGLITCVVLAARVIGSRPHWIALGVRTAGLLASAIARRDTGPATARLATTIRQLFTVRIPVSAWVLASGAALANWLLDALALAFCLQAVGVGSVSALHLLLAYTAGMAAASFPIVPAGLGVVDTALVLGLATGGATTGGAVAAVVAFRVVSLGVVGGSGWALWLFDRRWPRAAPRG